MSASSIRRDQRNARIMEMYARGMRHNAIAVAVGISRPMVTVVINKGTGADLNCQDRDDAANDPRHIKSSTAALAKALLLWGVKNNSCLGMPHAKFSAACREHGILT